MSVERFADHLRRHRLAAGLTQEELAERSGLSVRGISDLERGVKQRPHPETVRLLATALDLSPDALAAFRAAATPAGPVQPTATLPEPLTPLVGRGDDALVVTSFLGSGVRLVTLTGPGGVGKTRLAIQVAGQAQHQFADGIAFVPLAALADPDLVPGAIAQALNIRELPDRPLLDVLARQLQERHLLLVLDNLEHLPGTASHVATLLAACPRFTVLATSRSPLQITGEHEYRVRPLARPDPAQHHSLDELASFPAITLFVHQAQAVQPAFEITTANSSAVTAICTQVDGLPLALELAAVRMKTLAPSELEALLQNRLGVLTHGPLDHPARHRTMRSTIGWSHDLLSPEEQVAFRRFAVFVGGATRESAAAVLAGGDDIQALDLLTALLDQSLLQRVEAAPDESRFTMLETIREYARDRLAASDDEEAIRDLHASYFLDLSERGETQLNGPQQARWMNRLETEYGNLRAAMAWLIERRDAASSQRMGSALWHFWAASGRLNEGRDWLDRALALSPGERAATRAQALLRRGNLAIDLADYLLAQQLYEECLAIHQELSDELSAGRALDGLGLVYLSQGNYAGARVAHETTLALWRAQDRNREIALALQNLGNVAVAEGDYAAAATHYAAALEIRRKLGDDGGVAWVEYWRGQADRLDGRPGDARVWLSRARAGFLKVGDRFGVAYALNELGCLAHDEGHDDVALAYHLEALREREEVGHMQGIVECLEGVALVSLAGHQQKIGVKLLSAASAWRRKHGVPMLPALQRTHNGELARAQSQMSPDAFVEAKAEGEAVAIDHAIGLAFTLGT